MMRKACVLSFAAVVLCLASPLALAAQRTFVGATGTDNPSCSLPAPCRTFTAAIAATSDKGEIIVLDSAGYGTVTITKSVSIIAPPGIYAGISVLSGDGVTINAPGATVVLRGLSINGQGGANGIISQAAALVRVENCVISNMTAVGIYHQASNGEMIVLDTIVRDSADTGIGLVALNASIVLDHVRSEHNQNAGFYIAPSPLSVYAKATINDSLFVQDNGYGIWADTVAGARTEMVVERSTFINKFGVGFYATAAAFGAYAKVALTRNSFHSVNWPIKITAIVPGYADSHIFENTLEGSYVFSDGSGSIMTAGSNSGMAFLECTNGGVIRSRGTNNLPGIEGTGCITIGGI